LFLIFYTQQDVLCAKFTIFLFVCFVLGGFLTITLKTVTAGRKVQQKIWQDLLKRKYITMSYCEVNIGLFILLLVCTRAEFGHWLILW